MAISQFFRALFSHSTAPNTTDLSFGLLEQTAVKLLLRQKQWAQLEARVAQLSEEELTRLLDGLCLTDRYTLPLSQYLQAGTSDLRRLVAGIQQSFLAWQARGMGGGSSLTEKQIQGFLQHLHKAQEYLSHTFSSPQLQAEAYARLIRVEMGLSAADAAQQAFYACRELAPHHLLGHMHYFKLASPRWLGDQEILAEFVDEAPTAELHGLLQANFLVEMYSDLYNENTLTAKQELLQAHQNRINQLLPGTAPLDNNTLLAIYYNNYFACLNHILGYSDVRNAFLAALEGHITFYPWAYFGLDTPAAVQKLLPRR